MIINPRTILVSQSRPETQENNREDNGSLSDSDLNFNFHPEMNPLEADVPESPPETSEAGSPPPAQPIPWTIFLSRALSAWGDRLWSFGIGIFMNVLGPKNLRLVAIYGFSTSVTIIIFGASIGSWIDRTARLTSAKTFLAVQNLTAVICCAMLAAYFFLETEIDWPDDVTIALPPVTIIFAVIANLASVGSKIAVEKDWVVVISNGDKDRLAKMNSTFRTIDLLCLLVAPLLAGVVFDFAGNGGAAIFIALWNLISVVVEYLLLLSIYNKFPELSHKQKKEPPALPSDRKTNCCFRCCCHPCLSFLTGIANTFRSWKLYLQHPARNVGLALAFLYMTVLAFDNITYGYCMRQCVTESILGALVGVSAVFGVTGSVVFPVLRKKIGLVKTGSFGFGCLILVLLLSVASIWIEGSPFKPELLLNFLKGSNANQTDDNSSNRLTSTMEHSTETVYTEAFNDSLILSINGTLFEERGSKPCVAKTYMSVAFFLAGVISARFGLWIADLSINQIQQEEVENGIRGRINGVQSGLNSGMTTVKFILVILLPEIETYGWLVLISFLFICFGSMFYTCHAIKTRIKPKLVHDPQRIYGVEEN